MKKLVLFSVAALMAGVANQAFAYNMIHPFYSPDAGHAVSKTSFDFTKEKAKEDGQKGYIRSLAEKVEYSITDQLSVSGRIARDWYKGNTIDEYTSGNHVSLDTWGLGVSYTAFDDGKHHANISGEYWQYSGSEEKGGVGMIKAYTVVGTYGYNFDAFTPYMTVSFSNALNHGSDNDEAWKLTAAAYKEVVQDLGMTVGFAFDRNSDDKAYYGLAEVGYQVAPKAVVSVYGNYLFNDDPSRDCRDNRKDSSYKVGARVSVEF